MSLSATPQTQTADHVQTVNFTGSVTTYASPTSENWQIVDNNSGEVMASGTGSSFSFTPSEGPDSYTATLTVTDAFGLSGTGSVTISVVDNAPNVSLSASPQTQDADQAGAVSFTGSVSGSSNTYSETWQIVDNATGSVVDSGTGENFSFMPTQWTDSYTATMTATDEYGVSGSGSTTIVINDSPPVVNLIVSPPSQYADQAGTFTITASVTAYAPIMSESWQVVDNATGSVVASGTGSTFSFTPGEQPDSYTATMTATDITVCRAREARRLVWSTIRLAFR